MENYHSLLLALAVLFFVSSGASAVTPPNQTTTIDNLSNLTENSSDITVVKNTLPFAVLTDGDNATVSPGFQVEPQKYSGEVTYTAGNNTTTRKNQVKVPEVSNWSLSTASLNRTISVGSSGELTNLTVALRGNTPIQISANLTGGLAQYLETNPVFTVYPGLQKNIVVGFQVPKTTDFGGYEGRMVFTDGSGTNQSVNISAKLEDRIDPSIDDTSFPNLMATRSQRFEVVADDNLNISSVSAEIVRAVEVKKDNQTVRMNETVGSYRFKHKKNTDSWALDFTDTEVIAPYYVNLTVNDTAGNTVYRAEKFQVKGLDSIEVLQSNFEFESVYPSDTASKQSKATEKFLQIDKETPVSIKLERFSHADQNSSITVGVLKPGEEVATKIQAGESAQSSKSGQYKLVVQSDEIESYSGRLNITLPEQHVGSRYRLIEFEGLINDPKYVPEQKHSLGVFESQLSYEDNDNDPYPDRMQLDLSAPADRCKGFVEARKCPALNDWTLGEIPRIEEENQKLTNQRNYAVWFAILSGILVALKYRRDMLQDRIVGAKRVKKEDFNKEYTDEDLEEVLN